MKLTSKPLAAIIFVILFGGILLTSNLGWFQTTSSKIPVTYPSGEFAGQYNPVDIRGSYLFGEVSDLFKVPLPDLQAAFLLPAGANPASYQVKNLEAQFAESGYEIGTGSVRLFVAFYNGTPYDLADDTYLPKEAAQILAAHAKMTAEQAAYLAAHTVDLAAAPAATPVPAGAATQAPAAQTTPTPPAAAGANATAAALGTPVTTHVAADRTITGKTTFQELLDWGVPKAAINQVLGMEMPAGSVVIKDFLAAKGLEFSTLKTALQAEVDKTK